MEYQFVSLNINGLRRHFDEIKLMLFEINVDILVINETKLNASYLEQLTTISAYQHIQRKRNSSGGGISMYIRESIKFKQRKDIPMNDLELICQ